MYIYVRALAHTLNDNARLRVCMHYARERAHAGGDRRRVEPVDDLEEEDGREGGLGIEKWQRGEVDRCRGRERENDDNDDDVRGC